MIECMRTDAKKSEPAQWILKRYLFRGERIDNGEWAERNALAVVQNSLTTEFLSNSFSEKILFN